MATAEPDYYCHKCDAHIGHVSNNQCPHCQDSFIEEIQPQQSTSSQTIRHNHPMGRVHVHSSYPHPATTIVFDRPQHAPQFHRNDLNDIGPFFQNVLAQLFGAGQQLPFMTTDGRQPGFVFDAFLTQLLNQMGENSGPAPASETRINSIPTVEITREQAKDNLQCTICMEEFQARERVKRLPCSHHFHEQCIATWLRLHGTCPTCRVTLEGDNTTNREYFNIYPNQSSTWNNNDRGNNGSSSSSGSTLYEFD